MIESISLNSYWRFITDENDQGRNQGWHASVPDGTENIQVPSCWNELKEELYHYETSGSREPRKLLVFRLF